MYGLLRVYSSNLLAMTGLDPVWLGINAGQKLRLAPTHPAGHVDTMKHIPFGMRFLLLRSRQIKQAIASTLYQQ